MSDDDETHCLLHPEFEVVIDDGEKHCPQCVIEDSTPDPEECCICFRRFGEGENYTYVAPIAPTNYLEYDPNLCRHWICVDCFPQLKKKECPSCRNNWDILFQITSGEARFTNCGACHTRTLVTRMMYCASCDATVPDGDNFLFCPNCVGCGSIEDGATYCRPCHEKRSCDCPPKDECYVCGIKVEENAELTLTVCGTDGGVRVHQFCARCTGCEDYCKTCHDNKHCLCEYCYVCNDLLNVDISGAGCEHKICAKEDCVGPCEEYCGKCHDDKSCECKHYDCCVCEEKINDDDSEICLNNSIPEHRFCSESCKGCVAEEGMYCKTCHEDEEIECACDKHTLFEGRIYGSSFILNYLCRQVSAPVVALLMELVKDDDEGIDFYRVTWSGRNQSFNCEDLLLIDINLDRGEYLPVLIEYSGSSGYAWVVNEMIRDDEGEGDKYSKTEFVNKIMEMLPTRRGNTREHSATYNRGDQFTLNDSDIFYGISSIPRGSMMEYVNSMRNYIENKLQ